MKESVSMFKSLLLFHNAPNFRSYVPLLVAGICTALYAGKIKILCNAFMKSFLKNIRLPYVKVYEDNDVIGQLPS